jgi:hypothetical protein
VHGRYGCVTISILQIAGEGFHGDSECIETISSAGSTSWDDDRIIYQLEHSCIVWRYEAGQERSVSEVRNCSESYTPRRSRATSRVSPRTSGRKFLQSYNALTKWRTKQRLNQCTIYPACQRLQNRRGLNTVILLPISPLRVSRYHML